MTKKRFLLSLIFLLGLAAYIYKVEIPGAVKKAQSGLWLKADDAAIEPNTISKVTVKREKDTLVFKNNNSAKTALKTVEIKDWSVDAIPEAKLDYSSVNALLNAVASLKLENALPKDEVETDLSVYGLKEPKLEIGVSLATAAENKLLVGNKSEFSNVTYLKKESEADVYAVSNFNTEIFKKNLEDYRDRAPVAFDSADVKSFTVESYAGKTTLERQDGNSWKVVALTSALANTQTSIDYLTSLGALRVKNFIDEKTFGVQNFTPDFGGPSAKVTLNFKNPDQKPLVVLFRVPNEDKRIVPSKDPSKEFPDKDENNYFMIEGTKFVYSMDGKNVADFAKVAGFFREKRFVPFNTAELNELKVKFSKGAEYTLVKDQGSWKIKKEASNLDTKDTAATDLVNALQEFEASDFADESDRNKVTGDMEIQFDLKFKDSVKTLTITKDIDWKGAKARFATFGDDKQVYVVSEDVFSKVFKTEEELKK